MRRRKNAAQLCRSAIFAALFGLLGSSSVASQENELRIRLLTISDPFALAIQREAEAFASLIGREVDAQLVDYSGLRQRILLNAFHTSSQYDLIAVDVGWAKEIANAGLIRNLDDLIARKNLDTSTYLTTALRGATVNGRLTGLPVQPHAELLFVHTDLLRSARLEAPATTSEVIEVARRLHKSREGLSGICWNAQRGAPLGQTVLHFLAAFGGRALDSAGRPTLDTEPMLKAIDYAVALSRYSPPDILTMEWDARINAFATRRCALTYGWTARSMLLEQSGIDLGSRSIRVVPAPAAPGQPRVSPLGTWLLSIPSNLDPTRIDHAFDALVKLTSVQANRLYVKSGVGTLLHTALVADREIGNLNAAVALMGELEKRGQLQAWMRPDIAAFQELTMILGNEVHAVLTGGQSAQEAARKSQSSLAKLLGY